MSHREPSPLVFLTNCRKLSLKNAARRAGSPNRQAPGRSVRPHDPADTLWYTPGRQGHAPSKVYVASGPIGRLPHHDTVFEGTKLG